MSNCKAIVNKLETFGLVDGPGVRVVIFLQGCNMRCKYCHNPETWTLKNPNAKEWTAEELVQFCLRYKSYWGDNMSNGGVTFSGGEPLLQLDFLFEFARIARKNNISIAIDTCGQPFQNTPSYLEKFDELASLVDLFLVDIKCMNEDLHKSLTGHSNKNILDMILHLSSINKNMWIRHVLVPSLTDDEQDLLSMKNFVSKLNGVKKVEVLPYHDFGAFKYKEMGMKYPLEGFRTPTNEEVQKAEKILGINKNLK